MIADNKSATDRFSSSILKDVSSIFFEAKK